MNFFFFFDVTYVFLLNFLNFVMSMFMPIDQLESLSYFGHCAHSSFYYLCNLVCLCLFPLTYFNEVILFVNSAN